MTIKAQTIITFFHAQELGGHLTYNPRYRVLICKTCGFAITPTYSPMD